MEHTENAHDARPRVLDAVNLLGWQVKAGSRAEGDRLATDVRESPALDDVTHLIIGMTVIGCTTRLDDPDELSRVHAARILVDEVAEGAVRVRAELRAVFEPNDHLSRRPIDLLDRHGRRDDQEVVGPGIDDRVRLAGADVRSHLRLELVRRTLELERARPRDDVEQLVAAALPPRQRAAGPG